MTPAPVPTVSPGVLNIIASDFDARPMSYVEAGIHQGYEADLARLVCDRLHLTPVWHNVRMEAFYKSLQSGQYDVIWFNQAITPERQAIAPFTRPYGLFDESVLVRADSSVKSPADLAGLRVGGLADSTNVELAASFANCTVVPYPGSDKVLPEMLAALRAGEIDALIDDELVLIVAAEEDPNLKMGFNVPTQVPFGIGVYPENTTLVNALNETLDTLITDGTLSQLWSQWIPWKAFPF